MNHKSCLFDVIIAESPWKTNAHNNVYPKINVPRTALQMFLSHVAALSEMKWGKYGV